MNIFISAEMKEIFTYVTNYIASNTTNVLGFVLHISCRNSVVGIATRYGLGGPGIESR
jgi:hypothetical protein